MERISMRRRDRLENLGFGLVAAALLATNAMAFVGAPTPLPAPAARTPEVLNARLEGLVVTPSRTYRASEWALRRSSANQVAMSAAQPQRCALPRPPEPPTRSC